MQTCAAWMKKKALTGKLKQKAFLGVWGVEDGLSPCASSCNLPVLNKVLSLPSFFFFRWFVFWCLGFVWFFGLFCLFCFLFLGDFFSLHFAC